MARTIFCLGLNGDWMKETSIGVATNSQPWGSPISVRCGLPPVLAVGAVEVGS